MALSSVETELQARYDGLKADARRERAFEAYRAQGLPHRRIEGWRWSDVREAVRGDRDAGDVPVDVFDGVDADVFRFSEAAFESPKNRPAGVRWFAHAETPAFGGAEELPMAALAAALADDPSAVVIDIAAKLKRPIRLVFEGAADRFHHVAIVLREGATAQIIESHVSGGGFANTIVEYGLEAKTRLDRVIYQAGAAGAVQTLTAKAHLDADARFTQSALLLGAKLARAETHLSFQKPGAEAVLDAAYLLADGFHADVTSHVRHSVGYCETRQLTKGAVKAGGKGVFQGKFYVARDAQKTDAEMAHHALLLEEGGEVNAKPELEIYADDVQCAHGNTTGALDADALFYMRQRGIPEAEAKAMLTASFVADAFDNIADEAIRDLLTEEASRWLTAAL